eukprot:gene1824-4923_t
MAKAAILACAAALIAVVAGDVYLKESFEDGWDDRWVLSKHKSDYGKWDVVEPKYSAGNKGLKTTQDAKFYAISTKFDEFSNEGKDTYVQSDMHGESPYNVMFGPDICGQSTRKVHVILNYNGENVQTKKTIPCKSDEQSHLYTLVIRKDNTYEVRIDGDRVEGGNIEDDFDMLPPKKIKDPNVSKPSDWVDEAEIPDPEDEKPEDWDQPEHIADPDAEKPEDWDDEMDGEWEAPMIPNPEYKGEWKPRMIPNPEYKGKWIHPEIDNPDYSPDDTLYKYDSFGVLGFDLWQVKSGTIFDDILITDESSEVDAAVKEFKQRVKAESAAEQEAKAKSEEAAEEEDDDEDEDDEDDDEDDTHDEL